MTQPDPSAAPEAALRDIPSADAVLRHATVAPLLDEYPRGEVLAALRNVLDEVRAALRSGSPADLSIPHLAIDIRTALHRRNVPSLRRVINATGVVLHTGLGRAPLAEEAIEAVAEVARGYCNLEFDLENGERGDRHVHCRGLLRELTGAEDALVVNNNAAATLLALRALARGRDVLISRGQIVEIGGSYRMPDIMAASGCNMVEVGTTNRTRIADYERAISERTAALIRVHTSNYRVVGFTHEPGIEELVALARRYSDQPRFVIDDLGSGWLPVENEAPVSAEQRADWDEPSVRESIAAGADVCLFSGDKLLGGPQAGVILGRSHCITQMRADPLARAFRPDKMALAALEATLRLYRDPAALQRKLPVVRMLHANATELESAARRVASELEHTIGEFACEVGEDASYAGGGSLPTLRLPTWIVCLTHPRISPATLAAALRQCEIPIIARIHDERLVLDCRTIGDDDIDAIVTGFGAALREILES